MKTTSTLLMLGTAFLGLTVVAGIPRAALAEEHASALTAFVTSQAFSGDLGGIAGADAKCQQAADAAGLSGHYKAWLSDGAHSPATTFVHSTGPYVRTDGAQIAPNWDGLVDGGLDAALDRDEYQNVPPNNPGPWTATRADGTSGAPNCSEWTYGGGDADGSQGCTSVGNDPRWTDMCGVNWCNSPQPLYCFEVASSDGHADHHPPSEGAQGMAGAEGTFSFKPDDWQGDGVTTWWVDTDGVDPGTAGCHLGRTAQGEDNGRMFGEACTETGLLVESNPGAQVLHSHADDTGHPDLFDCNAWCQGQGSASGSCSPAPAPPCASSARCVC